MDNITKFTFVRRHLASGNKLSALTILQSVSQDDLIEMPPNLATPEQGQRFLNDIEADALEMIWLATYLYYRGFSTGRDVDHQEAAELAEQKLEKIQEALNNG